MALSLKSIREKRPEAIVLVGLPGSGKSTWAKSFKGGSYPVFSTDTHIERLAREHKTTYVRAYDRFGGDAQQLVKRDIAACCRAKTSFIWDQTNETRRKREAMYKALSKTHSVVYVCFLVPIDVCVKHSNKHIRKRGKLVGERTIKNLAALIEFPTRSSGEPFDRIVRIKHPAWGK